MHRTACSNEGNQIRKCTLLSVEYRLEHAFTIKEVNSWKAKRMYCSVHRQSRDNAKPCRKRLHVQDDRCVGRACLMERGQQLHPVAMSPYDSHQSMRQSFSLEHRHPDTRKQSLHSLHSLTGATTMLNGNPTNSIFSSLIWVHEECTTPDFPLL